MAKHLQFKSACQKLGLNHELGVFFNSLGDHWVQKFCADQWHQKKLRNSHKIDLNNILENGHMTNMSQGNLMTVTGHMLVAR